ncbi:MAG: hypothetical protein K2J16_06710 [Clostridia bacterium]|nr:hypothetical protein [Clostridia bacterium]
MKNCNSKIKGIFLTVVIVLIGVIVAGLTVSVVTGTKPQEWFTKAQEQQTFEPMPVDNRQTISLGENGEGASLYINKDKAAYAELPSLYEGFEDLDGGMLFFLCPAVDSYDENANLADSLDNGAYAMIWLDRNESKELCIYFIYCSGETSQSDDYVLYNLDKAEFGKSVQEDGRIVLSDKAKDFVALYPDDSFEDSESLKSMFCPRDILDNIFSAKQQKA